jgi:proline iminopeptidase
VEPVWQQQEELGNVKAKTLLLVGKEDMVCKPEVSEAVVKGIEQAEMVVLEKCGHFPWLEAREEFFAAVERFLEK